MLLTIEYLKLLILVVLLDLNVLLIRHVFNVWIIEEISGRRCCRELFNSSYVRRDIEAMDGAFVLGQMIALNKSLIAQLALESFSCVPSYVGFKIISLTKAFSAKAENEMMMSDDMVVCSLLCSLTCTCKVCRLCAPSCALGDCKLVEILQNTTK